MPSHRLGTPTWDMSSLLAVAMSRKIANSSTGTVGEASNLMTPDPDFDLTRGVGATIRESSQSRRFDRNQFLFHAGEPSGGMYLIVAGFVAVRLSTPSGELATVAVLGTGNCLGEQSLLAELGHRSTSAVALGTVDTLFVARVVFDELRERDAALERFLTTLLDTRLRRVTDRLVEALYTPAPRRVLRRGAELAQRFGDGNSIPLTQDDVASMAGTTRPTVNRTLRQAEAAGAIALTRGSIWVIDAEVLANLNET